MRFNRIVIVAVLAGASLSASVSHAAETDEARIVGLTATVVRPVPVPAVVANVERPLVLPALYVALGATQVWDVYSTRSALRAGGREANPAAAAFSGNMGALMGMKAATTAATILFAERMWKKHRVAAIVMVAAINGATAAVSMHNMRTAKIARAAGMPPR
jgi:hypothetical protein